MIDRHPYTAKQPASRRPFDTLVLDKLITANKVAKIVGVHVETIYKWAYGTDPVYPIAPPAEI